MNITYLILAIIFLFGVLSLFKSSDNREPFIVIPRPIGSNPNPLDPLSEIAFMMSNLREKPIPIEDRKVWVCDSKWSGKPVLGHNLNIDCNDPTYNCNTKANIADKCKYIPLPSSLQPEYNIAMRDEIRAKKKKIQHMNVFIPPTTANCKIGCKTPNYTNTNFDTYDQWTCDAEGAREDLLTFKNITEDESNVNMCNSDLDCIWCNSVGFRNAV